MQAMTEQSEEAARTLISELSMLSERGISFMQGNCFYRAESAQGRDLAVLAAAVHRQSNGRLRVLDVMSGSGVRGARYLQQVRGEGQDLPGML